MYISGMFKNIPFISCRSGAYLDLGFYLWREYFLVEKGNILLKYYLWLCLENLKIKRM